MVKKRKCSDGIVREFEIGESAYNACSKCSYINYCTNVESYGQLSKEISFICEGFLATEYPVNLQKDWPEFFSKYLRPKCENRRESNEVFEIIPEKQEEESFCKTSRFKYYCEKISRALKIF